MNTRIRKNKHRDMDMTSGSITRLLIAFAIPLMIGNIFQLLYNTVDSIIVGNYVGSSALAAIGCTTPIVNMFIFFFTGLATGAGVVISNYYGAKDDAHLSSSVRTTMFMTLVFCIIFTILGVVLTPVLLKMMKTPDDVFQQACDYLRIFFSGIAPLLIYNMCAGILRAVGDSTRPLYVLIFCTILNTILDLLFVYKFGWGVKGAAVATVASITISSVTLMIILLTTDGNYKLKLMRPVFDVSILKSILSIGLPSAVQMGITAFSNVFVQSYVNRFGSSVMAGWAAYVKIDNFVVLPSQSLGVAVTTFLGQNIGARKPDRVKVAPLKAVAIGFIVLLFTCIPLMIFAPFFVSLFGGNADVIEHGTFFIRRITPFYIFFLINQIYAGVFRGSGYSLQSMVILLTSFVVVRQIYLFIVWQISPLLTSVSFGYPVGWICCSILLLFYYYYIRIRKNRSNAGLSDNN